MNDPNRLALQTIARALGTMNDEVVYVGGAVIGLLVTDPASAPIRPTDDVDCIIEVASRAEYDSRVRNQLLDRGFSELIGPDIPVCAWTRDGIRLDVMPTDDSILGFSSSWYAEAIETAKKIDVGGIRIRVITAPYLIATKLEAFKSRGRNDYLASHDLEDIVALIDSRVSVPDEVLASTRGVRRYIADEFGTMLADSGFAAALPGLILDPGRVAFVRHQMNRIVSLSGTATS